MHVPTSHAFDSRLDGKLAGAEAHLRADSKAIVAQGGHACQGSRDRIGRTQGVGQDVLDKRRVGVLLVGYDVLDADGRIHIAPELRLGCGPLKAIVNPEHFLVSSCSHCSVLS